MNTTKFSRVIALLLSLVMLLGTLPSGIAEAATASTIVENAAYEDMAQAAAQYMFDWLMDSPKYTVIKEVESYMLETQFAAVMERMTEAEHADFDARLEELYEKAIAVNNPPAGDFMPPVDLSANAASPALMLLAADDGSDSGSSGTTTTDNGLELLKDVTKVDDDTYKVRLDVWTTGNVTASETIVPVDIVLVLDQSSSMRDTKFPDNADGTSGGSYQEGLAGAFKTFVADVVGKYNEATADHRIAVVTFNSSGSVRQDWTYASSVSNFATVQSALDSGSYIGQGTCPDEGMELAVDLMDKESGSGSYGYDYDLVNGKNTTRQRVVIMFSDGVPSTSGSTAYTTSYADTAISHAKTLKDDKITVFSIGIFNDADPSELYGTTGSSGTAGAVGYSWTTDYAAAGNRYLNYLSSNSSDATSDGLDVSGDKTRTYTINANYTWKNSGYYLKASSKSGLIDVFSEITNKISTPSIDLGTSTVVKDIVTPTFEMPNGTQASQITFYTEDYNGTAFDGTLDTAPSGVSAEISVDSTTGLSTINVTGYNFNENCVVEDEKQDGTYGERLVMVFDIDVTDGFLGGNQVVTNGAASGVYESSSSGSAIENFEVPDVDIKVEEITPTINDQHIYLSNQVDLLGMIGLHSGTNFYEYTLDGTKYSIDGVNNGYVDITYTFKDEDGNVVATFTVEAGETVGTLTYADGYDRALTEDTTFTIACKVDPIYERTYTYTESTTTATVYVYKPVLSFRDTAVKYLSDGHHWDYFAVNNYQGIAAWKTADGVFSTAVTMNGSVPIVTLTYDKTVEGDLLTGTQVTAKQDVLVNVTKVQLSGDTTGDYTALTSSIRQDCNCIVNGTDYGCDHTDETEQPAMGNNPEFIVHVYDVYGHLAITKTVETPDGVTPAYTTFTFTVELDVPDGEYSYTVSGKEGTETLVISGGKGTITLSGGQTATILELPPETAYKVTETVPTGYDESLTDGSAAHEGKIAAGKTTNVGVTNTYAVGSLTISKAVEGTYAPADEFTFTVNLKAKDGTALVGSYSYTGSKTGTIENDGKITLKNGESVTIANLPADATYTVTETENDAYVTTPNLEQAGTIVANTTQTAAFTNTYKYSKLTITKTVEKESNDVADIPADDTFTFTVSLPNGTYTYTVGGETETLTVSNGTGTLTLKNGESAVIEGVLIGADYTVTEQEDANDYYTLKSSTGASGKIVDAGNTAAFTNTYHLRKTQTLTVKKMVHDASDTYAAKDFVFTVDLVDGQSDWVEKQFGDAKSVTINAPAVETEYLATSITVPVGTYIVTEDAYLGFTTEYQLGNTRYEDPQNITVYADSAASVTVHNTRIVQDVEVTKTWEDNNNALSLRPDSITATLVATADGKAFAHGKGTLTVEKDAWSNTWTNLPTHDLSGNVIEYTVSETPVNYYTTTYAPHGTNDTDPPAFDLLNGDKTIAITNTLQVGDLTIGKTIVDKDTSDSLPLDTAKEFTFTLALTDAQDVALEGEYDYTIKKGETIVSTGKTGNGGTIVLKHGEVVTIDNLPAGTKYTVTEAEEIGYTTTKTGDIGTIVMGTTAAAAFTNTFEVADLTITKVIDGNTENDNTVDDVFTFEVTLPAGTYTHDNGTPNDATDDGTITITAPATSAQITITGENSVTIKNIPINTDYTVTEINLPTGYSIPDNEQTVSGTIPANNAQATFTNDYAMGGLTIEKVVIGSDAPKTTDAFIFTVDVKDAQGNAIAGTFAYTIGDVSDTITTGTTAVADRQISLKHGEKAIFTDLPNGATVTVTETAHEDYTTDEAEKTAVVAQTAPNVEFTNTYKYGSLTITKMGLDLTLDPNASTMYSISGNGIDMTVAISGNSSVTINHLPLGTYTVTELTDWSWRYESSITVNEPEITAEKNGQMTFNNTRSTTTWLDGETYDENVFDAVAETTQTN